MRLSFDKQAFRRPFMKRMGFCKGISLVMGILIVVGLPEPLVSQVPLVRAAAIINALIIGGVIGMAGLMTWHPVLRSRILPAPRGAVIAAFIHLDFIIYLWPDQSVFWQTVVFALAYGALLDYFATRMFGEGAVLLADVQPPMGIR